MNHNIRSGNVCAVIVMTLALASVAGAQTRGGPRTGTFDGAFNPRTMKPEQMAITSAIDVFLSIDGKNGEKLNTCETQMNVSANGNLTYYGTWTYTWTLFRNGQMVDKPQKQTITCSQEDPYCEPPLFSLRTPAVSGTYEIRLETLTTKSVSNKIEVTAAPPCPPKEKGNLLHVTGLTSDGKLWHSIRYATEFTWQPLQNVWLPAIDKWGIPGTIVDVSSATLNNELHVAVVNDAGKIFHAIRYPYHWQPFREIHVHTGAPGTFLKVAVAEVNRELHLTAVTKEKGVWHTIRHANSWDKFGNVLELTGSPGTPKELDVANVRGELHVLVLNDQGRLWHTIRHAASWDRFGDVQGAIGTSLAFQTVSGAAVSGELHVAAIGQDGRIWHTIRHPYSWDKFGDVQVHTGTPGPFARISVGQSGNELHVTAVTTGGGLYHTIRHANSWDKFGDVEKSNAGERGSFRLVSADGVHLP